MKNNRIRYLPAFFIVVDKQSIKYFIVAVIAMAILFSSGFTYQESKVIGKWKPIGGVGYNMGGEKIIRRPQDIGEIEFFKDNTGLFPWGAAKWNILDDGRIKITEPTSGFLFGTIQGDTLTIFDAHGKGYIQFKKN
jgi:hypothetical protein